MLGVHAVSEASEWLDGGEGRCPAMGGCLVLMSAEQRSIASVISSKCEAVGPPNRTLCPSVLDNLLMSEELLLTSERDVTVRGGRSINATDR